MVKPIDALMQEHVDQLFAAGTSRANAAHAAFIKTVDEKPLYEQAVLLLKEQNRLDKQIEQSEFPYYIENHSSPDSLLKQFANRRFLLNVNDDEPFLEAVQAGAYRHLLYNTESVIRDQVPAYTYEDFINGKECPYFLTLGEYYEVSEKDFYAIREWQSSAAMKIIDHDFHVLVNQLQNECSKLEKPLDFIRAEKEKIDNGIDNCPADPLLIKNALNDLFVLRHVNLDEYMNDFLLDSFSSYLSASLQWLHCGPATLQPSIDKAAHGSATIAGDELTIFYTINKLNIWFEAVLAGQPWQQPVLPIDYDDLLKETVEEAEAAAALQRNNIEIYVYEQGHTKQVIKTYLIEQFEKWRRRYQDMEERHYFHTLAETKRFLLKRVFSSNCFLGGDIARQQQVLRESIQVFTLAWAPVQIYYDIFETHRFPTAENNVSSLEIISLLNNMVLSKELYNDLTRAMDEFMHDFSNYLLPYELHACNQRDTLHDAFIKCQDRLAGILDQAAPTVKTVYLQSRLKQMRHHEQDIELLEMKRKPNRPPLTYSALFKKFLEIEAAFIENTKDLAIDFPRLLPAPAPASFENLLTAEQQAFVMGMLESLAIVKDGKLNISQRRKSAVRGVVESLRSHSIFPSLSIEVLTKAVAGKIGMELKSPLDYSNTSQSFQKKSDQYIKSYYQPSLPTTRFIPSGN